MLLCRRGVCFDTEYYVTCTSYDLRDVRHVRHRYSGTLDMRTRIRAADWFARGHDIDGGRDIWERLERRSGSVNLEHLKRADVFVNM